MRTSPRCRFAGGRFGRSNNYRDAIYTQKYEAIRKDTLVAQFGGDVMMPDVRHLIAEYPRKDA
jgi:hypothetical protein